MEMVAPAVVPYLVEYGRRRRAHIADPIRQHTEDDANHDQSGWTKCFAMQGMGGRGGGGGGEGEERNKFPGRTAAAPCLVLSYTRHWLGECSALGGGTVPPPPPPYTIYAPKGLGEPPCRGSHHGGSPCPLPATLQQS
jgi:hypothetical protein